jgi:capsular exopolysaccharide synthesis family protein
MNQPTTDPGYDMSDDGSQTFSIQDYISTVLRGKRTIVISLVVVLLGAIIFTLASKTTYESSSLVLLNYRQQGASLGTTDQSRNPSENKIANELGKLKSHILSEAVAQRLLEEPWLNDGKTERAPIVRVAGRGDDSSASLASQAQVAARARKAMDFAPERESDVIRITARSTDPREAALLSNLYAEAYQEYGVTVGRMRTKSRREFLQNQLASKRRILDSTETTLKSYMEQAGVVSLDAQALRVTQQLSQLEASRDAVDIDLQSLSKTLATYQQRLPEQEKEVGRVMKQASDPYIKIIQDQLANLQVQRDVLANPAASGVGNEVYAEKLKAIEVQIANLQKKLDDRTVSYLSTLPSGEMSSAQADPAAYLAQAKQRIFETQMQIQALQAKKQALTTVIQQYDKDFGGIPRKSIDLAKIQRARMSAEKLYLLVEERYNEAAIGEKSDLGFIDIIDTASVPPEPVSPNVLMNMILGTMIGLGFGFVIVFVREYLDVRIHTPEDLKRRGYALLSFVGRIPPPYTPEGQPAAVAQPRWKEILLIVWVAVRDFVVPKETKLPAVKVVHEGKSFDHTLVSLLEPFSPNSESYRRLRARLESVLPESRIRRLVVTSPNPGEGKTTTVANLGFAFAQAERRVLIVDSDLRQPSMHRTFGFDLSPGLSDILAGKTTLSHAMHANVIPGLDVLCAGDLLVKDPEILGSKHMEKFLKDLQSTYEWVLIDSSPVLAVSDAALLSAMVDGAVIVAAGGETRMIALERAIDFVGSGGGKVLGVFLNNFDALQAYGGFYGSDRYGYRTDSYGKGRVAKPGNGESGVRSAASVG